MISFLSDFFTNSEYSEIALSYWNNLVSWATGASSIVSENQSVLTFIETLPLQSLHFDQFQRKLLQGFLLILFFNIVFIGITWRIYGKGICERFMKPATSIAIEELKASVSKLKLPKEHSPRI